jgi:serine/threonine-protein kinase
VHRDVKPSNVLVRDIGGRDHAYLTDFGIAKAPAAPDSLTRAGSVIGTPGYLSPEQIRGQQPGPRSDLYALGCVMFEALTGQRPFGGDDLAARWAQATSAPPVASSLCPALGSRYDAFLAQALAADPQDRFPSGTAFAEALQAAHTGRPVGLTQTAVARGAATPRAYGPSAHPAAISEKRPATAAASPGQRDPAVPRQGGSRSARPATAAGAAATPATAPATGAMRATRPSRSGSRARPSRVLGAGQLIVLIGGLVFIASVTLLTHYANNGTGWKSLWQATHGDLASPLYPDDFWIPVALAALALICTAISAGVRRRLVMIGAALGAAGLIGYTLYIPSQGSAPGFQPYGSSYWLSLAATITMVIGAAVALAARSRAPGPRGSPRGTRQEPVR